MGSAEVSSGESASTVGPSMVRCCRWMTMDGLFFDDTESEPTQYSAHGSDFKVLAFWSVERVPISLVLFKDGNGCRLGSLDCCGLVAGNLCLFALNLLFDSSDLFGFIRPDDFTIDHFLITIDDVPCTFERDIIDLRAGTIRNEGTARALDRVGVGILVGVSLGCQLHFGFRFGSGFGFSDGIGSKLGRAEPSEFAGWGSDSKPERLVCAVFALGFTEDGYFLGTDQFGLEQEGFDVGGIATDECGNLIDGDFGAFAAR